MLKISVKKGDVVNTLVTDNAGYLKIGDNATGFPESENDFTDYEPEAPASVTPVAIISITAVHDAEHHVDPSQGFLVGNDGGFYAKIV